MAGLVGLMGGDDTKCPRSVEEPAKKEEESSLIDFGPTDRVLRVKVVRRGANRVSRSVLRVSRVIVGVEVNSAVDLDAQDRRRMDAPEEDTGGINVRGWPHD